MMDVRFVADDPAGDPRDPQLVLVFDDGKAIDAARFAGLRARFPSAHLLGCSTAGSIRDTRLTDDVVAAAIRFERTGVELARVTIGHAGESREAGAALARALPHPGLAHVFVLSDGLAVNGTALVRGLADVLPAGVAVTGGLAGDLGFARTTVIADAPPAPNVIAAVGFYGDALRVGFGSMGGWDPFGPERVITRARDHVLEELDHQSALGLYEQYLGEHAAGLPATGLLFPLSVRDPDTDTAVVRTILSVDRERQSLTFAGDMPVGHLARLMKANFDRLIDGAQGAARKCADRIGTSAELALLVSCVGRRLLLRSRTEEELESVREVVGGAAMVGFYSLGELCPSGAIGCELHNQTMTITSLREV